MGAAGDMLMGALLGLYPDRERFLEKMNGLMDGVTVRAGEAMTCGIAGIHMEILIDGQEEAAEDVPAHSHDRVCGHHHTHEHAHAHIHNHGHGQDHAHTHTSLEDIRATIKAFDLPEEVRWNVCRVYENIAEAEAFAHKRPVTEVHFHEVGAKDAIADITGVCYLIYLLKVERIVVSPINLGSGNVRCAHGILPVPAPATAFLLQGLPAYTSVVKGELCTPTGAALLKTFGQEFGSMPVMKIGQTGYGIGRKEFEQANCVRAFLGETSGESFCTNSEICELTANLDDMTAEALGYAQEILLKEGALDVFAVPAYMKKNRPAYLLTCLCRPEDADRLAIQVLLHTTTFGVRKKACDRYTLSVSWEERETPYGRIREKVGSGYGIRKTKPEYEEAARVAREAGVPLSEVTKAR